MYKAPLCSLFIILLTIFQCSNPCWGQQILLPPKNNIGVFGGIEFNSTSILSGVEYKRAVYTKRAIALHLKGIYIFKYKRENVMLFFSDEVRRKSYGMLMADVHFYTSPKRNQTGFFLNTAVGVGVVRFQYENTHFYDPIPAVDLGIGWHILFNEHTGMQIAPSVLFASEGGIIRLLVALRF